ncbi:MAG: glycosyltransferase family 2 protein [Desulfobaccales bacterium]
MNQSIISVIIPAFNAATCIKRCLESVLRQTHLSCEVIVIDDGSTDTTTDILRKYDDRITHVHQENQGPSAARNHGLRLARGDFVAFLDADDFWLPDFLSRCMEFFKQHYEAAAVSTGQKIITWDGRSVLNPPLLQGVLRQEKPKLLGEFFHFWAEQDHIRTGSCVIRRKLIDQAGYMREDLRLGEDLEYWGYLATYGTWGFIPEVLWIGDGTACDAAQGWLTKNRQRGKMCSTIEDWQQRILPRLKHENCEGFRVVRGRVAQTFAYAKLLGGDISGARHIALCYGSDFPTNRVSKIFRWLAPQDLIAWRVMSLALLLREAGKGWRLRKAHYICQNSILSQNKAVK